MLFPKSTLRLTSATRYKVENDHNQRNDEQQVDQSPGNRENEKSEQPKDEQYYDNRPQHPTFLSYRFNSKLGLTTAD